MRYCRKCILPDTRPNLAIDADGNCNCAARQGAPEIDWDARYQSLLELVRKTKALGAMYDCVVPVSGGKDSTWQTHTALELGLKPLCVTWRTPTRTEIGERNLRNLVELGVDHVDVSINPRVEKLFTRKSFEKYGSPLIPMHMALHAIPLQFALKFKIPVILQGENSAHEYGGSDSSLTGVRLTREWLLKYGVTQGTCAEDWVDDELSMADMEIYKWPSSEVMRDQVKAVFLGYFLKWDPRETFRIAQSVGFKAAEKPKTGLYEFADIDDGFLITIHHWMKWYKFGFTRLWDNLSLEIRQGRLSREQAIDMVRQAGPERPDEEIAGFCDYLGISREQFYAMAESFRDTRIWKKDDRGNWFIKDFLIEDWNWQES